MNLNLGLGRDEYAKLTKLAGVAEQLLNPFAGPAVLLKVMDDNGYADDNTQIASIRNAILTFGEHGPELIVEFKYNDEGDEEIGTFFVWCNELLVIVGDY